MPGLASPVSGHLQGIPAESLLQSGMSSFYGGSGSNQQQTYAHEALDSYNAHMEAVHRNENIDENLRILRSALGDEGTDGTLAETDDQATVSITQAEENIKGWKDVTAETLQAAPRMATAASEAASALASEHSKFRHEEIDHGKEILGHLEASEHDS